MSSGVAVHAAEIPGRAERNRSRIVPMLALVTAPVVAADQISKLYIKSHFQLYESMAVVPDWLDLTYTLNPGAAFSLFATMPAGMRGAFFIVLSIIALIVLTVLLARRSTPLDSAIAFALIAGGTIGNLIDRIARGRVIDFIYFHHKSFSYPIFNIADSAITIGVGILLLASLFERRRGGAPSAPRSI